MKLMQGYVRKAASFILSAAMVISLCPVFASAADNFAPGFPLPVDRKYKASVLAKYSDGSEHVSFLYNYTPLSSKPSDPYCIIDIPAEQGTPIYAVAGGTVYINATASASGNYIVLKHDDGTYSYYGHLQSKSSCAQGSTVSAGTVLGKVGMSGQATGPHLQFEWSGHDPYCEGVSKGYISGTTLAAAKYPHNHGGQGDDGDGSQVSIVFREPTDPSYAGKAFVTDTNATLVTEVSKPAGVRVSKMGMYLFDKDGNLLRVKEEDVSNLVSANLTRYHTWYDVNQEVGVTLTPGTYYEYQFYAVVNGVEHQGPVRSFTTTGSAPLRTATLRFDAAGGHVSETSRTVEIGKALGELPVPVRSGYTFAGWYTSAGSKDTPVTSSTVMPDLTALTIYAHWTEKPATAWSISYYADPIDAGDVSLTAMQAVKGEKVYFKFDPQDEWVPKSVSVVGESMQSIFVETVGEEEYAFLMPDEPVSILARFEKKQPSCEETGHQYGPWQTVSEPTCVAVGERMRVCSVCGERLRESISTIAHTPDASGVCTMCGQQVVPVEAVFADVENGAYYAEPVRWAVNNGITTGTSPTTFSPNQGCTRAQAVTFLWRAMGEPEPSGLSAAFADVPAGSYYEKAVAWAAERGITAGISDTMFGAERTCTRAQIVTFLYRASGSPGVSGTTPFADVDGRDYYYAPVAWAVQNGITGGTSPTTFGPNATCTRAQIMTFLYRAQ